MNTTYILELGRNIAFLLALTFAYSLFRSSVNRLPVGVQPAINGILFGLFGMAVMIYPITVAPGVFLDGRVIMLAIAGAFGGWQTGTIATLLVIFYRVLLGGAGVPVAIGGAITSAGLGSIFWWRSGGIITSYTSRHLIGLGALVAIQQLLWTLLLPPEFARSVFQVTLFPVMLLLSLGTYLLGTLLVTDQRRVEADRALRSSEERYRVLTENAVDLIYRYRFTPVQGFEYVSPSATSITGYTPEEHYADPELGVKIVHPEDQVLLQQAIEGRNSTQPLVLRWIKKDGQAIWTEQHNVPLYDKAGNLVAIEGIARNITKRKQAEEALKESEERYRTLYNQLDDAIFIHDQEGNILDVNQAACDRLGYSYDEFRHMKTSDIDAPDYASKFQERLQRQLMTGTLQDIRGMHVTRAGQQIPVHVNSRRIMFKGQVAILAVARDVRELQRAERQAVELASERTRVKAMVNFVHDISHDFRTPLTIIGSAAYLLMRSPDLEKRQQHFEKIETQVKQMTYQIERLLVMARLDAEGNFAFQVVKTSLFLHNISSQFMHTAQTKGVRLTVEVPDSVPTIQCDEQEMTQAIGEIVDNAIIFTSAGGVVTLRAEIIANSVVIIVQDTGSGIPATDLPHIFKRLYRGDAARSLGRGSTGLGLSIAEKIVEGHHGQIEVESTVGVGSLFRVILPQTS